MQRASRADYPQCIRLDAKSIARGSSAMQLIRHAASHAMNQTPADRCPVKNSRPYSHSIVPGGFDVMS